MAQTLADLQAAITAVGAAVDADAAQDLLVIAAIEKLIDAINQNPNAGDFTNEVAALAAAVATLQGSNTGVQTELDKVTAGPPTGSPIITPATLSATGQVDLPFSYAITASQNPVSFTAAPLPAGLTLNTSSGVISGIPTTAGDTTVTITAKNAAGTGTASLVISIA